MATGGSQPGSDYRSQGKLFCEKVFPVIPHAPPPDGKTLAWGSAVFHKMLLFIELCDSSLGCHFGSRGKTL